MPKIVGIRPFKIREDYDEEENIEESVDRARKFLKEKLDEANSISNEIFKRIAILTIIDSLAMEINNYPSKNSKEKFIRFVLEFQSKYDFLEGVEPITLFYDYEDKIKKIIKDEEMNKIYPELFPAELEIDLKEYKNIETKLVSEFMKDDLSSRVLSLIERQDGKEIRKKFEEKHKFINLIYKMRSKSVHEFVCLGMEDSVEQRENKKLPYYRDIIKSFIEDDKIVTYKIYELIIPSDFLYNLAENCIDNYLDYCLREKRYPYQNNDGAKRKVYLSWCD